MKKIFLAIIAGCLTAAIATSCGDTDNPVNERTILLAPETEGDTTIYPIRYADFHGVATNFIIEPLYSGSTTVAFTFDTWNLIKWRIADVPDNIHVTPTGGQGSGWFYATVSANTTGAPLTSHFNLILTERDTTGTLRNTITHTITFRQPGN